MMGTKNKQPIYEYLFTYNTSAGFVKNLFKIEERKSYNSVNQKNFN